VYNECRITRKRRRGIVKTIHLLSVWRKREEEIFMEPPTTMTVEVKRDTAFNYFDT
ncbi:hypothetical protein HHI36_010510, partial [Cryptolaemus montrouzieri]